MQGLLYKNLDGKSPLNDSVNDGKKSYSNLVYGADLEEVEKDDTLADIPKFAVECIKIIEMKDNIQTNGICRASGKKESIEKLKKKVRRAELNSEERFIPIALLSYR